MREDPNPRGKSKGTTTFLAAQRQAIQKDYNVALAGVFHKKKKKWGTQGHFARVGIYVNV